MCPRVGEDQKKINYHTSIDSNIAIEIDIGKYAWESDEKNTETYGQNYGEYDNIERCKGCSMWFCWVRKVFEEHSLSLERFKFQFLGSLCYRLSLNGRMSCYSSLEILGISPSVVERRLDFSDPTELRTATFSPFNILKFLHNSDYRSLYFFITFPSIFPNVNFNSNVGSYESMIIYLLMIFPNELLDTINTGLCLSHH